MCRVGSWVGASRWPNRAAHPSQWGKPIGGQILEIESPAAWAGTPDFPVSLPDSAQVMDHVMALRKAGKLDGVLPVMWEYGDGHRVIRWERASSLRPYSEDIQLWNAAKRMRLDELAHPRRKKPRSIAEFLPEALQHLAPAVEPVA